MCFKLRPNNGWVERVNRGLIEGLVRDQVTTGHLKAPFISKESRNTCYFNIYVVQHHENVLYVTFKVLHPLFKCSEKGSMCL